MRSFLSTLLVVAVSLAFNSTPTQSASRFNSQEEYLDYIRDCIGLFYSDHPQYEEDCTPGPEITIGVTRSRGDVPEPVCEPRKKRVIVAETSMFQLFNGESGNNENWKPKKKKCKKKGMGGGYGGGEMPA